MTTPTMEQKQATRAAVASKLQPLPPAPTGSSDHQQRWKNTWNEFNRALRSPEPFNPFPWIFRLAGSGLDYLYCQSGLKHGIVDKYRLTKRWTSVIPLLVMGLVVLMVFLYFFSLRRMIQQRWCQNNGMGSDDANSGNNYCLAIPLHDITVFYLGGMILYNYFKTNLTSPGVALSGKKNNTTTWSCMDNRGGFYGSFGYPQLDANAEAHRVSLYGKLESSTATTTTNQQNNQKKIFPSPDPSFCDKCDMVRPPRCHHCRVCNRCVLQFDHHCFWVNNCIGYNNYRSFLALQLHVVLACCYSIGVLVVPFYELVRQEQERQATEYAAEDNDNNNHGWLIKMILAYQRSQIFDDVPTNPWTFYQALQQQSDVDGRVGLPWTIAVKIVYPLLLGIGTIMSVFLGFHVQYVIKARTTLEHKVVLETLCTSLWEESFAGSRLLSRKTEPTVLNPFDDGWRNNICNIIGSNPWYLLLPISVETPAPYIPAQTTTTDAGKKTKIR